MPFCRKGNFNCCCTGILIVKEYPDDKPYPSILIFGKTNRERPLHIVCAYDSEEDHTIVITV